MSHLENKIVAEGIENTANTEMGAMSAAASLACQNNQETWSHGKCSEAGTAKSKSHTNEQPRGDGNSGFVDNNDGQSAEAARCDTACLHQSYPAGMATPEVCAAELDLDSSGLLVLQPDLTKPQSRP